MDGFVINILFGLSYGMVLFLLATGLSIVLGLMGVVNLAHGMLFMIGAYAGVTVGKLTGSFALAILAAVISAGLAGLFIERGFLRKLYKRELDQILVTFGFIYIITNLHLWIYGPYPRSGIVPSGLSGAIAIGAYSFSFYRLAVIAIGTVACIGLFWLQERTRIGAVIRAGMDDPETVYASGVNLMTINVGAFCFGAMLAGLAGIIGIPILGGVTATTGGDIIFVAISVCIVGGVGSIQGAFVGALLIGIVTSLAQRYYPATAIYVMYVLMVIVLVLKPSGLLGRRA
ncbi:MAG: branched-chain amino acid ABC transporter permease [Xanthobacteraceae bacterium]|jgi:branched-chain amino acid transport system permease protein